MSGLQAPHDVELLILGAGWTAGFLITLLKSERIVFASTTRDGRDGSYKFVFDKDSDDTEQYRALPRARTVVITFPLKGKGESQKLMDTYWDIHSRPEVNWILLGSTGIYKEGWCDHTSPYDETNPRAIAEDELIQKGGTVLNLAGLYSDTTRIPKTWVKRVAKSQQQLLEKDSLHLIHGEDVARAILQTHRRFVAGERWLVTDRHIYDWWDLVDGWGDELEAQWNDADGPKPEYRTWVAECMQEANVRALPRNTFKRALDSREFWKFMKILPERKLER